MNEIIKNDHDGILVPRENVGALPTALGNRIGNVDLRSKLGKSALKKFQWKFTVEKMTAEYDALYSSFSQCL